MKTKDKTTSKVAPRRQVQQRLVRMKQKEATEFKEHLDNLNDGVIAIILTVMVLEVPLPNQAGSPTATSWGRSSSSW